MQTPKNFPTYHREDSHLGGYNDCSYSSRGILAEKLDEQIAAIIKSLKLTPTRKDDVRKLLREEKDEPDPEVERKEIRTMLRLMCENYERAMYIGEEYLYWQKVNALKEKLELLNRIPEAAIGRTAHTLLNLHDSWEWATREVRKNLVRTMIQEVGCDVGAKRIVWVKVKPDYEILFRLMESLSADTGLRYWVRENGSEVDIGDIGGDSGTDRDRSQNPSTDVPQCLDKYRGVRKMNSNCLKVEIAQQ